MLNTDYYCYDRLDEIYEDWESYDQNWETADRIEDEIEALKWEMETAEVSYSTCRKNRYQFFCYSNWGIFIQQNEYCSGLNEVPWIN